MKKERDFPYLRQYVLDMMHPVGQGGVDKILDWDSLKVWTLDEAIAVWK